MADSIVKVIGIGGCGINIVNSIVDKGIKGVEYVAIDTDKFALEESRAQKKLLIGGKILKGLGSGGLPNVGENAALEDIEVIKSLFSGEQDCIAVITAGMGAGTGTGIAPIVAEIAKEKVALSISIACTPFDYEGSWIMQYAEDGIKKLCKNVDSIITLKNQGLVTVLYDLGLSGMDIKEAYKIIYNIPCKFVQLLSDIIHDDDVKGNVEFMKSVLKKSGDMFFDSFSRSAGDNIIESIHDATRLVMELNPTRILELFDGAGSNKCMFFISLGKNIALNDETKKKVLDVVNKCYGDSCGGLFQPQAQSCSITFLRSENLDESVSVSVITCRDFMV